MHSLCGVKQIVIGVVFNFILMTLELESDF